MKTLFLLDRNVLSVIKDANARRKQKGDKQQCMLKFLESIDDPQYMVSPLLSLVEGEHGREDNPAEKIAQLEKETREVTRFFCAAHTDSKFLGCNRNEFSKVFAGLREGSFDARVTFRKCAIPLVLNPVSPSERRKTEGQVLECAIKLGLNGTDVMVVLFLACLYGNLAAKKVLKLSKLGKSYNVMNDIQILSRIGLIMASTQGKLKVCFLTMDNGLKNVLDNIIIDSASVKLVDDTVEARIKYLPSLFPELTEHEALDLLDRLSDCDQ